ncbi:MAG: glycosyltransferase family 2 protein, partial [Bacillota bacterium]|nr:glycosyltransferase family 2 protein [Bacillota bacterium]
MITVLLAAWNGEAYIEEQLDSILGQTECGKLRILVSDDGSEDGTEAILARYLARYPEQMELVSRPHARKRQDAESGIPAAAGNFFWLFEQALEKERDAEGDYYMLSDQDDVWKPNKAERLMTEMKRLEEKLGADHPILVHSDMAVTDADRNVIHPSFFRYQNCDPMRVTFSELLVENSVTGGAVLMNRSLLELAGRRPAACYMHDWWLYLIATCFGKAVYDNRAYYKYRQHKDNVLGAATSKVGVIKRRLS